MERKGYLLRPVIATQQPQASFYWLLCTWHFYLFCGHCMLGKDCGILWVLCSGWMKQPGMTGDQNSLSPSQTQGLWPYCDSKSIQIPVVPLVIHVASNTWSPHALASPLNKNNHNYINHLEDFLADSGPFNGRHGAGPLLPSNFSAQASMQRKEVTLSAHQ